jgi:G patch domain-containing protein 1
MDEEDLEELRNSKRMVHTTEEMDLTGGAEAEKRKLMGPSVNDEYVHRSSL